MARMAHPQAMQPAKPPRTRTAPPKAPDYLRPRMLSYLLFDATGLVYLLAGLVVLRGTFALAAGPEAWEAFVSDLHHPAYVAFHLLTFVSAVFVGVRFFRLFPKAQPSRIGPLRPPPRPVIHAMLYAIWIAVTALVVAAMVGAIP